MIELFQRRVCCCHAVTLFPPLSDSVLPEVKAAIDDEAGEAQALIEAYIEYKSPPQDPLKLPQLRSLDFCLRNRFVVLFVCSLALACSFGLITILRNEVAQDL